MLKKTITYDDFNGDQTTEDFFFNLTRSELVELEMSKMGGLEASLKEIIASNDGGAIMAQFRDIIRRSYGRKSPDGKRFVKLEVWYEEFESSMAYDKLFMELVTDPEAASAFVQGIMPKDLMQEAQLKMEVTDSEMEKNLGDPRAATSFYREPEELEGAMQGGWNAPSEPREISRAEAEAMDAAELQAGLASKTLVLAPPYQDPQALTAAEMATMDTQDLSRGLASGRYVVLDKHLE